MCGTAWCWNFSASTSPRLGVYADKVNLITPSATAKFLNTEIFPPAKEAQPTIPAIRLIEAEKSVRCKKDQRRYMLQ
jgi:hypothetical protein